MNKKHVRSFSLRVLFSLNINNPLAIKAHLAEETAAADGCKI